jgi:hypothetical protein
MSSSSPTSDSPINKDRDENQKLKLQMIKLKKESDVQSQSFKELISKLYKELQESARERFCNRPIPKIN